MDNAGQERLIRDALLPRPCVGKTEVTFGHPQIDSPSLVKRVAGLLDEPGRARARRWKQGRNTPRSNFSKMSRSSEFS